MAHAKGSPPSKNIVVPKQASSRHRKKMRRTTCATSCRCVLQAAHVHIAMIGFLAQFGIILHVSFRLLSLTCPALVV